MRRRAKAPTIVFAAGGGGSREAGAAFGARLAISCLGLAAFLTALLAGAATAGAADGCPNAELRTGLAAGLPDCRAYEMVSPVDKNAGEATQGVPGLSADGSRVTFGSNGVFAGAQSGIAGAYRAERSAAGWQTISIVPPFVSRAPVLADGPSFVVDSGDLSRALFETSYPIDPLDQGMARPGSSTSKDLYRRNADGSFAWVSHGTTLPDTSTKPVSFVAGSDDLSRILMSTRRALAPPVPDETVEHLYLHVDGVPTQLVDVDPSGNPIDLRPSLYEAPPQLSADGSRVAFLAGAYGARKLYLRLHADDPARAETIDLGRGTEGRSCTDAALYALSADGGKVLFGCVDQLTDEPLPAGTGTGIYLRDLDSGSLRLLGRGRLNLLRATPDLSTAYFTGSGTGVDGTSWEALVLQLRGARIEAAVKIPPGGGGGTFRNSWISTDGRYLAFSVTARLGFPTAGFLQVYRYDAVSGAVDCASCRPDGGTSTADATISNPSGRFLNNTALPIGGVSDDGEVFFTSAEPLVPGDQNGTLDAYSWSEGGPHLISSGRDPVGAAFAMATPDGRNVFFITPESLVPQDTDGGATDMYDARVGGGFPPPVQAPECAGDTCQGPPAPAPAPPSLGSAGLSAAGNAPAARRLWVSVPRRRGATGAAVSLRVRVPAAGRISVAGRSVRRVSRSVERGAYSVRVRLTPRARRALRRRGDLRAKVRVRFEPDAGGGASKAVRLAFRQPHPKHATAGSRKGRG